MSRPRWPRSIGGALVTHHPAANAAGSRAVRQTLRGVSRSMQTVNFQCGHCRNVMGVNADYLGKQVRCPHCQQVVLAPAQAAAPVPVPAAAPVPAGGPSLPPPGPAPGQSKAHDPEDSIFGEQVDEDLFGSPPKSKLELPPGALQANLQLEPTVFQVPGLSTQAGSPTPAMVSNSSPAMAPQPVSSVTETLPSAEAAVAPTADEKIVPRVSLARPESNIVVTSLLIILIPYSILMTVIALMLWFNQKTASSPYEMLPDLGNP